VAQDPAADEYRRRAAELRRLIAELEASPVLRLHHAAGTDTWSSPGAEVCRSTLRDDQARLLNAIAELAQHAWWYEQQADALEAIAAAARPLTPGG
jgi:hypothetical protein